MGLRWNWTLVAKGASSDTLKDRLLGIRSKGRGPVAAKLVRFRAVRTRFMYHDQNPDLYGM